LAIYDSFDSFTIPLIMQIHEIRVLMFKNYKLFFVAQIKERQISIFHNVDREAKHTAAPWRIIVCLYLVVISIIAAIVVGYNVIRSLISSHPKLQ
jgi:hypothetical protein